MVRTVYMVSASHTLLTIPTGLTADTVLTVHAVQGIQHTAHTLIYSTQNTQLSSYVSTYRAYTAQSALKTNSQNPELAGRFAGLAAAGGGNQFATSEDCEPDKALSLLVIHGDADPIWPYVGGPGGVEPDDHVATAIDAVVGPSSSVGWAERQGCSDGPTDSVLTESITETRWADCEKAVVLMTVAGAGHTWPGGWQHNDVGLVGTVDRTADASELVIGIFEANP